MATVESSDIDVVAEFGVPLIDGLGQYLITAVLKRPTHGASEGVTGSDGGGGRLIRVGGFAVILINFWYWAERCSLYGAGNNRGGRSVFGKSPGQLSVT